MDVGEYVGEVLVGVWIECDDGVDFGLFCWIGCEKCLVIVVNVIGFGVGCYYYMFEIGVKV